MKITGRRCVAPKKELRKLWSLLPPERRLGEFPQFSAPRVHVLLRRAIELLLGSWPAWSSILFSSLCRWSPVKTGKLLRLWQIWSLASRCNQVAPSGSRGNLGGRWRINSLTSKHWLFDISAINPLCDLDDLLCQGLVQVSENYELEPPGVSGNYDWRSTSFCTREAEEPWFVSKALASKYSLLLILSLSWVFPFKLTV